MSIIRWITDRIPPYAAVLLNGVITAVAVSASLFTTSFGTQTSIAIVVLSFFRTCNCDVRSSVYSIYTSKK